jgi:hypothetical protein
MLISLTITIVLMAPLPAQTPTPAPVAVEAQVNQELTEAAQAYRKANFAERRLIRKRHSSSIHKTRQQFILWRAQFTPSTSPATTPENIIKAREAISAYQKVLERVPDDEEAYKAIAFLYGAIKEDELLREWIRQRAENVLVANDERAEALVVLARKDWDCSFEITEQPGVKIATVDGNKMYVRYRVPKDPVEFERAKECANCGLEDVNTAIVLMPEYGAAWSYKTSLLLEGLASKVRFRDWTQSVQGAVATWSTKRVSNP